MSIRGIYTEENVEAAYDYIMELCGGRCAMEKKRRRNSAHKLQETKAQKKPRDRRYTETVTFLLSIPVEIWTRFVKTVPISRTRHDFIIDLIQRRIWEYERSTKAV